MQTRRHIVTKIRSQNEPNGKAHYEPPKLVGSLADKEGFHAFNDLLIIRFDTLNY
jgi:hypothetical protein